MPDINQTQAGLAVFISDGDASQKAGVVTTTPSASDPALEVREVARGQQTATNSIPVVLASDQTAIPSNAEKVEDNAHVSGDTGIFILGVRNDVGGSARTSANGDYSPISVDSNGRLIVAQTTASQLNASVIGNTAHDSVDSGNPVKVGGVARTSNPTAVANADRAQLMTDDVGRLVTVSSHVRDLVTTQYTLITSSAETTVLTAGAAGVFHDIVHIALSSDSNNVGIDIRDATAGSIVWNVRIDADDPVILTFNPPLPQTTAANNWTMDLDTGSANVSVMMVAVKNV